ncbi:hypothetical protein, partial [Microbacterium sp.]|uniref:hypothetical protein n=1 Tax=Microbacterium sp. TaxID=51671 RepID=UPI0031FEEF95|nr:hypothetical protein [Microbacterium sp.]
ADDPTVFPDRVVCPQPGVVLCAASPALEVSSAALLLRSLEGGAAPAGGRRSRSVPLLVIELRHGLRFLPR